MGWKDSFAEAMSELGAIRKKVDDPDVGLTALNKDLTQRHMKVLETVQGGVTGLREENRELRRRQERMLSDLNDTRTEIRQLLNTADVLRAPVPAAEESAPADVPGDAPPAAGPWTDLSSGSADPAAERQPTTPESDTVFQGETVEHTAKPQPEPGNHQQHGQDEAEDSGLKSAIEKAYRGADAPAEQPAEGSPQPSAGTPVSPQVAHGVLLLKAAGLASAEVVAHRDTWEWVSALACGHTHFRTPPFVEAVKDGREGRIRTVLSGRSLIALLIELWNTRAGADPFTVEWAMSSTVYTRITHALSVTTEQGETIRIFLDDGLPTPKSD